MALNVVICDDSNLARKQVKKSLPENWDIAIDMAENGQQALDLLKAKNVELLFLDLTMPVLDGIETLEAIRAEELDIVVIVISADFQPEMQKKVIELGAVAFVQKPVNTEKIAEVLQQHGLL